ncbi:hypothetical protein BC937DRAFT_93914 [Endogone sp. FLAS-F59071]|nr:hypothetical protein BC937DRAFT_93914 [Endogone sp. FLAS-F59071]|eukprot:RUS14382.1 hypothetical protein BC937DRAFT_93914 [Endogone sp. FLAS-F59071]
MHDFELICHHGRFYLSLSATCSSVAVSLSKIGLDGRLGNHLHEYAVDAGFRDVVHNVISLPIGYTWNDVVGRAFANDKHKGLKLFKESLSRAWQISEEEYERRITAVHYEWNHIHKAHSNCGILVAKKSIYAIDIDDPQ